MQVSIHEVYKVEILPTTHGKEDHKWTTIVIHSNLTRIPTHVDIHTTGSVEWVLPENKSND